MNFQVLHTKNPLISKVIGPVVFPLSTLDALSWKIAHGPILSLCHGTGGLFGSLPHSKIPYKVEVFFILASSTGMSYCWIITTLVVIVSFKNSLA